MRKSAIVLGTIFCLLLSVPAGAGEKSVLNGGWSLLGSAEVGDNGEAISQTGYDVSDWHGISLPSTVLAGLVANGVYPDPYFGRNLQTIPGVWPPPLDVSSSPMPTFSPFKKSFWYRTEFAAPEALTNGRFWLHLEGINYAAELWLNGKKVAGRETIFGTYRKYDLDVTDFVLGGKLNCLALEVFPPGHRDLAMTWVDWNPAPPDRNMGVYKEIIIESTGPVILRHPYVHTDLPLPAIDRANLTVYVDAVNGSAGEVSGVLAGRVGGIAFEKPVNIPAKTSMTIACSAADFPGFVIQNPELWWPAPLGPQKLHPLELEFKEGGMVSHNLAIRFGIREIDSVMSGEGNLIFRVNGKNILIKGAGWAPDMMLRQNPKRLAAEIRYVKEMNLNTVRLEGKIETEQFYDLCDQEGVLVMSGWCCCHHWERWGKWDDEDYFVAYASQRDQLMALRHHASNLAWLDGSDNPPPYEVEKRYLEIAEECKWPNPVVSSATEEPADFSGPSGVKMTGPYEWVPPVYWYEDTRNGGAFGFNTETSPGPAVPPIEGLRDFLPEDRLWPINADWNFHAGRGMFGDLKVFTKAQDNRYGKSDSAEEYTVKAQAMAYEGQRAMFEAYSRNKYLSTGVIQWMLNDAWPSIIWHLYDYQLRPAGGYFGVKKACEPLHVQFSYDDRSVVVVNSYYRAFPALKVEARIHDFDMNEVFKQEATVNMLPDSSTRAFELPEPEGISPIYFVDLALSSRGEILSRNFYWLSTKKDELNWPLTQWYYTPAKEYADFTRLEDLPEVELKSQVEWSGDDRTGAAIVAVRNPSPDLAFMVRLKLVNLENRKEILPVFWSDNYFPLLPGEEYAVSVEYRAEELTEKPAILIEGWNVKPIQLGK